MVRDRGSKMIDIRTKCRFDNTDLRRGRIKTGECAPVIDNKPGADYIGSSINGTSLKREQGVDIKHVVVEEEEKRRTTKGTCNRLDSSS